MPVTEGLRNFGDGFRNPPQDDLGPKVSTGVQGVSSIFDTSEGIGKVRKQMSDSSKGAKALSRFTGGIGGTAALIELWEDSADGTTSGEWTKFGIGIGTTFAVLVGGPWIAAAAAIYTVADLVVEAKTGSGIADRIGAGIDNMIK